MSNAVQIGHPRKVSPHLLNQGTLALLGPSDVNYPDEVPENRVVWDCF
jgi:hypothetical protein